MYASKRRYRSRYNVDQPIFGRIKRKTKKKVVKKVTKPVKAYVEKAIKKSEEVYHSPVVEIQGLIMKAYVSNITPPTMLNLLESIKPRVPAVGDGSTVNTSAVRGTKISIRKLLFTGYISCGVVTDRPFYVKMVIGKRRESIKKPINLNSVFENGSSYIEPSNTLMDLMRKPNKNEWTMYKSKTFAMKNTPSKKWDNSFRMVRSFSMDLTRLAKTISFEEGKNAIINNKGLYAWFYFAPFDGTVYDVTKQQAVINYSLKSWFTDN